MFEFLDMLIIFSWLCKRRLIGEIFTKVRLIRFTIECGMKLIALNFKYFTIPWNVFDFIIVIASIIGMRDRFDGLVSFIFIFRTSIRRNHGELSMLIQQSYVSYVLHVLEEFYV